MIDMNILFLDFDGCINTKSLKNCKNVVLNNEEINDTMHNAELCSNINELASRYSMNVVCTSSWRKDFCIDEMKQIILEMGIYADLIDYTTTEDLDIEFKSRVENDGINSISINRSLQISKWLKENYASSYIIIDDDPGASYNHDGAFFLCNPEIGFDKESFKKLSLIYDWKYL